MDTKICRLTGTESDNSIFEEAGAIIRGGGLVAFPTETVYGLGGNALDPDASRRIYAAKGRPSDNPLILHIADIGELAPLVRRVPEAAARLMEAYWPGPMTLVFEKSAIVPLTTTGGLDTAAVRMPSHEAARRLISAAGVPIAAPSANISGRPSPTSADHVIEDLDGRIDMIIDGGEVPIGLESTIIDVTGDEALVLRPGYIGMDEINRVAGSGRLDPAIVGKPDPGLRPKAPGMKYRHYAPKADITIVKGRTPEAAAAAINRLAAEKAAEGFLTRILCADEHVGFYPSDLVLAAGSLGHEETIAHNLYGILRGLDSEKVDFVFSESFETGSLGGAIMNRLVKAAGYHVLEAR